MLTKIISGAQTGADIAGLKAARDFGVPTGGTIPLGCRTLDGPKLGYLDLFGLKEHSSAAYPPRTICNVLDSDGSLLFASNWNTPGEKLTLKTLLNCQRPSLKIDVRHPRYIVETVAWLDAHKIHTLNIAGNSEQTSPGIERLTYIYLITLFAKLGFTRVHTSIPDLNPVQV